jgi:SSS family solute:Na+ symporter
MAALLSAIISSGSSLMNAAMILSELSLGNLQKKNALILTRIYILLLGFAGIITALFISKIIATLLFALAVFSGSFFVPSLAGLLNLKVNKQRIVAAIIAGGLFALAGKILTILDFSSMGNILIIAAHPVNAIILFWPGKMLKH